MSYTIAVVDDDPSVRRGLSRLLRSVGFGVTTFESAEQFLAAAPHTFACVVIDVRLGGMTGFELARQLDPRCDFGIVFITAYDEYATSDALRAAGSPPCLRKPFDAEDLLAAVNHAVGRMRV